MGGTRLGAPGGIFTPLALTKGMPLGILKWEAYTCTAVGHNFKAFDLAESCGGLPTNAGGGRGPWH